MTAPTSQHQRPARASHPDTARAVGWTLALIPAAIWVGTLLSVAANLPAGDDYFSLLPFVNDWSQASVAREKWSLITTPFISHRIIVTKLFTIVDWWVFGEINWFALQVFGWLGWAAVAWILLAAAPSTHRPPWLALPIMLLLFNANGHTNHLVAVGAGNLWVLAFGLLAIRCAFAPRRRDTVFALLFATLSALSFVNGLLVFPVVAFGLVWQSRWRRAVAVAIAGALVWGVYLHGYRHEMGPLSLAELARKAAMMTGGFLKIARTPDPLVMSVGALVLLGCAVLLSRRALWRRFPVLLTSLLFLSLSVAVAARGRAGWDDSYMLQDRYRIYGLLMIATGLLVLGEQGWLRPASMRTAITGAAAVVCALSYAGSYAAMVTADRWHVAAALNWQLGQCFAAVDATAWPIACANIERAEKLDTYRFPRYLSKEDLAQIGALPRAQPGPMTCTLVPNGAAVGWSICASQNSGAQITGVPDFGVLIVDDRPVILPVEIFRARLLEAVYTLSPVSDRYGLILPRSPFSTPGRRVVFGIKRNKSGRLEALWSGTIDLPVT